MSDLISRQAAIDIFDDYNVSVENGELEAYSRDRKRLCELQSAQPEIIRCKDCKKNPHWEWVGCPMTGKDTRKPEDYCSYAERRTDGSD